MLGALWRLLVGSKKEQAPRDNHGRPTVKQRAYAKRIGLKVPSGASRRELSAMIAAAERKRPELEASREAASEAAYTRQQTERYGAAIVAAEARWNELANANKWAALVRS